MYKALDNASLKCRICIIIIINTVIPKPHNGILFQGGIIVICMMLQLHTWDLSISSVLPIGI